MNLSDTQRARIATMTFASVYPHYVNKATRKGRTEKELLEIIEWLTGYTADEIQALANTKINFEDFFDQARLHPNASLIKGVICGYRVEEIEDPLVRHVRYLDKIVDELAKGKSLEKIKRS